MVFYYFKNITKEVEKRWKNFSSFLKDANVDTQIKNRIEFYLNKSTFIINTHYCKNNKTTDYIV